MKCSYEIKKLYGGTGRGYGGGGKICLFFMWFWIYMIL